MSQLVKIKLIKYREEVTKLCRISNVTFKQNYNTSKNIDELIFTLEDGEQIIVGVTTYDSNLVITSSAKHLACMTYDYIHICNMANYKNLNATPFINDVLIFENAYDLDKILTQDLFISILK